jgi:two-component system chemotaxis response regulator CheB
MVVDDSAIVRGLFTRVLEAEPGISVIASAGDGAMAVRMLEREDPDVILLDIEMPNMDGLTALPKIKELKPDVVVIMASTLTKRNAEISMRALSLGADDYVAKPSSREELRSAEDFKRELVERVKALAHRKRGRLPRRAATPVSREIFAAKKTIELRTSGSARPEILAIGSSTGGPKALADCLGPITAAVSLPIIITQHMPPTFTEILAKHLGDITGWPSAEGQDGELIKPRQIYVAPGGHHMLVARKGPHRVIRISDAEAENFCRPSVDPMLRSMAEVFGSNVLVLILTGMGSDGKAGCEKIVQCGGTVIAQDEETSVVWGMPGAVAVTGLCSAVLPINEIPGRVSRLAA